ncbi:hypothetical protein MBANPS3_001309 [Mucor bainieri]
MHKGSCARYFYRKCLILKTNNPNPPLRKNASAAARKAYAERETAYLDDICHDCQARDRSELEALRDADTTTGAGKAAIDEADKDRSNTKNGSEQLLRLEAYEPLLDTPVELLHTLPLGVGKSLVTFLWKTALTKPEQSRLQAALVSYRNSPSYGRSFRVNMAHNGSFLGRDYKLLGQILPVVLRQTFTVSPGSIMDLLIKCFSTFDVDLFVDLLDGLVQELTARVLLLDNQCIVESDKDESPLISLQPKLHLLHHLKADIRRFKPAVHFETEHGEQFNKFIREQILLTNRHDAAKDVAVNFMKQFVVRHILNGGSFLVYKKDKVTKAILCRRTEVGYGIKHFLANACPEFKVKLLSDRENADNNDYHDAKLSKLKEGTSGLFTVPNSSQTRFGRITRIVDRIKYIQYYAIAHYNHEKALEYFGAHQSNLFGKFLTNQEHNIVLQPVRDECLLEDSVVLYEHLDFSTASPTSVDDKLLNTHKFGTLWRCGPSPASCSKSSTQTGTHSKLKQNISCLTLY